MMLVKAASEPRAILRMCFLGRQGTSPLRVTGGRKAGGAAGANVGGRETAGGYRELRASLHPLLGGYRAVVADETREVGEGLRAFHPATDIYGAPVHEGLPDPG